MDSCSSSAAAGAKGSVSSCLVAGGVVLDVLGVKARGVSEGLRRLVGAATLTDELTESPRESGCRNGKDEDVIWFEDRGAGGSMTCGVVDETPEISLRATSGVEGVPLWAGDSLRKDVVGGAGASAEVNDGPKILSKVLILLFVLSWLSPRSEVPVAVLRKKGFELVDGAGLATPGGGLFIDGTGMFRASSSSRWDTSACRWDS